MRCQISVLVIILTIAFCSCKKDLLHWQSVQKLESGSERRLCNILFLNDTTGFIIGGERFTHADILTTYDGGKTFSFRTLPEAGKTLFGITKDAAGAVYAVGFDGKFLRTTDNGVSWSFRQLDIYDPYKAVAATSTGELLLVGGISFERGFTLLTRNIGEVIRHDTPAYELNDIVLLPDGTGYMCGYGYMARTLNNGITWQQQSPDKDNFKALDVRSNLEVWACGYNGSIYHTTNGGQHWDRKRNGNDITKPRYHLQDLLFIDAQHGYAVGEDGLVIYTDDGGDHWMEFDRFTSRHLNRIALCPDGNLLVCGDGGTLYRLLKK